MSNNIILGIILMVVGGLGLVVVNMTSEEPKECSTPQYSFDYDFYFGATKNTIKLYTCQTDNSVCVWSTMTGKECKTK